jgi:hypothetical protein
MEGTRGEFMTRVVSVVDVCPGFSLRVTVNNASASSFNCRIIVNRCSRDRGVLTGRANVVSVISN